MIIKDFTREHIADAGALGLAAYEEERLCTSALPAVSSLPDLTGYADNGLGSAAFENGKLVGYLCACLPFDNVFGSTDVKGIFSPMGANGSTKENRERIYAALYQHAAAKWVRAGAISHAVCLYAHDTASVKQFFQYGFGMRCIDAVRPMEMLNCNPHGDYECRELLPSDYEALYPLHQLLHRHYIQSPFFMPRPVDSPDHFLRSCLHGNDRHFGAFCQGTLCAFLTISPTGETFITESPEYRHITGAYCLEEHRGQNVYQNLMNHAIKALKKEGFTRIGVDFESINPTAYGFWLKYFTAYTYGVVRRIDDKILDTF